jgi:hypothetical protein
MQQEGVRDLKILQKEMVRLEELQLRSWRKKRRKSAISRQARMQTLRPTPHGAWTSWPTNSPAQKERLLTIIDIPAPARPGRGRSRIASSRTPGTQNACSTTTEVRSMRSERLQGRGALMRTIERIERLVPVSGPGLAQRASVENRRICPRPERTLFLDPESRNFTPCCWRPALAVGTGDH